MQEDIVNQYKDIKNGFSCWSDQSNQKSKSVFGVGNEQITILCDETNKKMIIMTEWQNMLLKEICR